jgi:hypothetical protein
MYRFIIFTKVFNGKIIPVARISAKTFFEMLGIVEVFNAKEFAI